MIKKATITLFILLTAFAIQASRQHRTFVSDQQETRGTKRMGIGG
jgi:hypothetical protein